MFRSGGRRARWRSRSRGSSDRGEYDSWRIGLDVGWPPGRSWRVRRRSPASQAGEGPTLRLTWIRATCRGSWCTRGSRSPAGPGKLALWYPKWVPGTHAPCGPVQDVAGLRLETPDGKTVPWRRDETEVYRVECDVPDGVESVRVRLDVICDKPGRRSARAI